MSSDEQTLSRRAIAVTGWMPGMLVHGSSPLHWGHPIASQRLAEQGGEAIVPILSDPTLDLDDLATLGCLEGRLRGSWPCARISIDTDPWTDSSTWPRVRVRICPAPGKPCRSFDGRGPHARAEAIVAALEWRASISDKFLTLATMLEWTQPGVIVALADDEAIRQQIYQRERLAPAGLTLWSCDDVGALDRVPALSKQQRVLLVSRTADLETLHGTTAWELRRAVVDFRELDG